MAELSPEQATVIGNLVRDYVNRRGLAQRFSESLARLFSSEKLVPLIHSIKHRAKDPEHLRDKLSRKMVMAIELGQPFDITSENLFERINDLAGVRLLHLHTSQFEAINKIVLELLGEEGYNVLEGPAARTWDDEYKSLFERMGVPTVPTMSSGRMYTSVHYVINAGAGTKRTAEIQVRTLAEELWGEVDHTINYPHPCPIPTCGEQIKVLARVTSSCTRLVDSIFFARNNSVAKK